MVGVAVGKRNQRVGVGTEHLSFKEVTLTAIILFCVGHDTTSGYYTKVLARQKTRIQLQHRYNRLQCEDVAVVAVHPSTTPVAFLLVQSLSRTPSSVPPPSIVCTRDDLRQPWDLPGTHTFTGTTCYATGLEGQVPKDETCLCTTVHGSGSHAELA